MVNVDAFKNHSATYQDLAVLLCHSDAIMSITWNGSRIISFKQRPDDNERHTIVSSLVEEAFTRLEENPSVYTYSERCNGFCALKSFYDLTRHPQRNEGWSILFIIGSLWNRIVNMFYLILGQHHRQISFFKEDVENNVFGQEPRSDLACCYFTEQEIAWMGAQLPRHIQYEDPDYVISPHAFSCPLHDVNISNYPSHDDDSDHAEYDAEYAVYKNHYEPERTRRAHESFYYNLSFFGDDSDNLFDIRQYFK